MKRLALWAALAVSLVACGGAPQAARHTLIATATAVAAVQEVALVAIFGPRQLNWEAYRWMLLSAELLERNVDFLLVVINPAAHEQNDAPELAGETKKSGSMHIFVRNAH